MPQRSHLTGGWIIWSLVLGLLLPALPALGGGKVTVSVHDGGGTKRFVNEDIELEAVHSGFDQTPSGWQTWVGDEEDAPDPDNYDNTNSKNYPTPASPWPWIESWSQTGAYTVWAQANVGDEPKDELQIQVVDADLLLEATGADGERVDVVEVGDAVNLKARVEDAMGKDVQFRFYIGDAQTPFHSTTVSVDHASVTLPNAAEPSWPGDSAGAYRFRVEATLDPNGGNPIPITVTDDDNDPDTPQANEADVTWVRLTIWSNGLETGQNENTVIGRNVALEAKVEPASVQVDAFKWTIPGKRVKDFTCTSMLGEVVELTENDLTADSVSFYWYKAGTHEVELSATIGGESIENHNAATFEVKAPTVVSITATPSSLDDPVRVSDAWMAGTIELHFGTPTTNTTVGMRFSGSASSDLDTAGKLAFIQVVDIFTQHKYVAQGVTSTTTLSSPNGHKVLDSESATGIVFYDTPTVLPVNDTRTINTEDSPGSPLSGSSFARRCEARDSFEMYLMYQPEAGGIWVPLKKVTWDWSGLAEKPLGGVWALTSGNWNPKQPKNGEDAGFPEWTDHAKNLVPVIQ